MPKAIIVGAGINGLATAWGLTRRGWTVTVLEAGPLPNPRAASFDLHRLIRAQYGDDLGVAHRIGAAYAAWDTLWADLGATHLIRRGTLGLSREPGDFTDRSRAAFVANGAGEELAPEEVAARFPLFPTEGVRFGLYDPAGGMLLADRILRDLIRWLGAHGATLRALSPVTAVNRATGEVTFPGGREGGDVTILSAGVGLPALAPDLAGALAPYRATILYCNPAPEEAALWETAPCWTDLGGVHEELWGIAPAPGLPLKIGNGVLTGPGDPATQRLATHADVAATLAAYRGRIRGAERITPLDLAVNFYLMAPDGRFVVARDGRTVLLSADSGHGFKFGALTGLDLAAALDGGDFAAGAARITGAGVVAAA
ncbi:MAG: sarcosine oxidase [Rhodovulum sulfidophilum]|uniref:Sarcosine oxidase n=1 Tax=Rhodovulum sulfidophilum TaxID=35806 RepID=A0A2W5N7F3_RHOSU|nr:MAG: sarcosine oxidase [Rhodovulum sulfidophilum]